MPTGLSFTAEEWTIIRSAPQVVSMAVAGAGGGILGAIKETMAGSQAMIERAQSRSVLVQKLCSVEEIQAAQEDLQKLVMSDPSNGTPEKLKAMAVQLSSQAVSILSQRASSEVGDYQNLVLSVADAVAKAAKEGGFFGFGGELVSEGEEQVIAAVQAVFQGRAGTGGTFSMPSQQPTTPQVPQTPSQPSGPVGPSRSAGLPGLEPKSSTPPPTTTPPSSSPPATTSKPKSSSGLSTKSGASSTAKTKGGFRTGSGMRKADK